MEQTNIGTNKKKATFFQKKNKLTLLLIPSLLTIILIGLIFSHNLSLERSLPSEGWSRSITLDGSTGMSPSFTYAEDNEVHIYNHNDGFVTHFVTINGTKVKEKNEIPVKIKSMVPFWAHDNKVIFLNNGNLTYFDGTKEEILVEEVDGLSTSSKHVVFWKKNELFSMNLESFDHSVIGKSAFEIDSVYVTDDSFSVFVISDRDSKTAKATLYQKIEGTYSPQELFSIDESGVEEFTDLDFIETETEYSILYSTFSMAQQKRSYRTYWGTISKVDLVSKPTFKEMHYHDSMTNERIRMPRYAELFEKNGQPTILFSAEGATVAKRIAINIYEATQVDDIWKAERRSTGSLVSVEPEPINDKTMTWLDFSGEEYLIKVASADLETVSASKKITKEDWNLAASHSLTSIFTGFLVLFISIIWIIFPVTFLAFFFFAKSEVLDQKPKWIEWVGMGLFVGAQILFHEKLFNRAFQLLAPDYLTFAGNYIVLPLLIGIVSFVVTEISYNREWGAFAKVSYFMGINILVMILLIGPYTL